MGFFDKIKKSVSETIANVGDLAEDTLKTAKAQASDIAAKAEKTYSEVVAKVEDTYSEVAPKIGEVVSGVQSTGAKGVSDATSYIGDTITEAVRGDYTKLKEMASATGDFVLDAAKDMSGINAYNHYQEAKQKKEEAEDIIKRVESEVDKIRYYASERLRLMGEARRSALKNTVGRFITIVERMNQSVRDKEYEMLKEIDIAEGEIKEMEVVAIGQKKMVGTVGVGLAAASAAAVGAQKLAIFGVTKLATASTGTAIKNLSGAAAQKATMAWLGGGSVSAGGGGVAAGASRLTMIGGAASGIMILTTAATVASIYYSQKNTESTQYLADVKVWEAKTLAACDLMKMIVRRSDEIATLTTRLETRCVDALDSLEEIVECFDSRKIENVKIFQKAALLVKSVSQLCQTPLIDSKGELNEELNTIAVSSEKVLNKNL